MPENKRKFLKLSAWKKKDHTQTKPEKKDKAKKKIILTEVLFVKRYISVIFLGLMKRHTKRMPEKKKMVLKGSAKKKDHAQKKSRALKMPIKGNR